MKKIILFFALCFIFMSLSAREIRKLAGIPTAGILQKGEAEITSKLFKNDGLMIGANVGLVQYFMFGVSFSGENVVGDREPEWQKIIGFSAKYRVMDETEKNPAVVIGFENQGSGRYWKDYKRYDYKSKGIYLAFSKNYLFMGNLGLTAGTNYSLENEEDSDLDIFFGFDKSIGNKLNLLVDYSVGINDYENDKADETDKKKLLGKGRGYLNAGLKLEVTPNLSLQVNFNDILVNAPEFDSNVSSKVNREIVLTYSIDYK